MHLTARGAGQNATDQLIPSDNTASTFWITNPDNTYRGNVSAGSEATGFWMAFPEHPTGKFEGTEISKATWPRRTQLREFSGNVAHSDVDGLMFDRGPNAQGKFNLGGNTHLPYTDPSDTNSARLEAVIKDFTSYKNSGAAIWARGENHVFNGLKTGRQRYRLHTCVPWCGPVPRRLYLESRGLPVRGRNRQ